MDSSTSNVEEVELDGWPFLVHLIQPQPQRSELNAIPTVSLSISLSNNDTGELTTLEPARSPPMTVHHLSSHSSNYRRYVKPQYPEFITLQKRLSTFDTWKSEAISAVELAEAGFVYLQKDDNVMCYHCGMGVHDWLAIDNAWTEHAKWAPWCTFIYIKCGIKFIDSCLKGENVKRQAPTIIEPDNDRYRCKVCLEKEIGVCFFPCDHSVTYLDCAPGVATCPMCRDEIIGVYRLKFID